MAIGVAPVRLLYEKRCEVLKVSEELGLVFGWAIVCTENGQPYYDSGELILSSTGERVAKKGEGYVTRDDKRELTKAEAALVRRRRDHIPEHAMLEAAVDFAANSRVAKEMHDGEPRGQVVFSMPLTTEVAEAFGIVTKRTGLMVAAKLDEPMLAKFRAGTLTGFSIGGYRVQDEVQEQAA